MSVFIVIGIVAAARTHPSQKSRDNTCVLVCSSQPPTSNQTCVLRPHPAAPSARTSFHCLPGNRRLRIERPNMDVDVTFIDFRPRNTPERDREREPAKVDWKANCEMCGSVRFRGGNHRVAQPEFSGHPAAENGKQCGLAKEHIACYLFLLHRRLPGGWFYERVDACAVGN